MNNSTHHDPLPGSKANKPFDIFGFIYRYGMITLCCGMFLLTMLVPLVLKVKKPNYETHSILKIDPVIPSLITKSEEPSIAGFYHDFVRTQASRIGEFEVMAEAFRQLPPEQREALVAKDLSEEESITILQRLVNISPVSRTHLVRLSIHGPKREGLAPMLNALMATFLSKMQQELELKDIRRLTYLTEKKTGLQKDIWEKELQLQNIATTVLSSTFTEDYNVWQKRVVDLQKSYIHIFGERVKAENAHLHEKKLAESLRKLPLGSLVEEGVMNDRAIDFTSSWTYQQLQDLRSSIDGVTVDNYDRKLVEQRMRAMREYEKKLRTETRDNIKSIIYGKQDLELRQSLIQKENTLNELQASEQDIISALSEAEAISGKNSSELLRATALETELNHSRELLFRIDTRIHELEAESRAPLRVTIESRAKEPGQPAGSNIKKLLMACVTLSFGSVGCLFILLEFFDNRIRSPKNILHALGHPSTWPISSAPEGIDFHRVLSDSSDSVASKAIRSLANRLFREHEERDAKVFLFTAVGNGCGTSSITENSAQALTYHSSKVLVIDANLQTWETPGAADYDLTEEASLNPLDAIQQDSERGIDYLVSFMPRKSTPATSRMLARLLKEVREDYDFICIDASPVLYSDLTEYLAANCDAGVLIIQGDSSLYRDVRRSAEILVRLEIPALAPVLNWGGDKTEPWFEKYIDVITGLFQTTDRNSRSSRKLLSADCGIK